MGLQSVGHDWVTHTNTFATWRYLSPSVGRSFWSAEPAPLSPACCSKCWVLSPICFMIRELMITWVALAFTTYPHYQCYRVLAGEGILVTFQSTLARFWYLHPGNTGFWGVLPITEGRGAFYSAPEGIVMTECLIVSTSWWGGTSFLEAHRLKGRPLGFSPSH